jgi:hypothetical protein
VLCQGNLLYMSEYLPRKTTVKKNFFLATENRKLFLYFPGNFTKEEPQFYNR